MGDIRLAIESGNLRESIGIPRAVISAGTSFGAGDRNTDITNTTCGHFVIRIMDGWLSQNITMSAMVRGILRHNVSLSKCNRQKAKIPTAAGWIVTNSPEPIWHFYVIPNSGDWNTFKFPRVIETAVGNNTYNLEYSIYSNEAIPRGTICNETRGCKGYKKISPQEAASKNIRICNCDSKAAITEAQKENRKKPKLDLRTALLGDNAAPKEE
jgi:hypothetical protein